MKKVLEEIVKCLVDQEDKVVINEIIGNSTHIYEVIAEKEDTGKIIGKEGKTASAIRTILKAVSKKDKKRYILSIL